MLFLFSWQFHTELTSLPYRTFPGDGSAVEAHNPLANGETQTGSRGTAGLISLVKAIEYFFSDLPLESLLRCLLFQK